LSELGEEALDRHESIVGWIQSAHRALQHLCTPKGRAVTGKDQSPLSDTEVHFLQSDHVGDNLNFLVGHCGIPEPASRVLYLGDPAYNFGPAVEIVRLRHIAVQRATT
jgi:hypothetical protein